MLLFPSSDEAATAVAAALAWAGFEISFQRPGDTYALSVKGAEDKGAEDREAEVMDIAKAVDPAIQPG